MAEFKTESILPIGIFCIKILYVRCCDNFANRYEVDATDTLLVHKF